MKNKTKGTIALMLTILTLILTWVNSNVFLITLIGAIIFGISWAKGMDKKESVS